MDRGLERKERAPTRRLPTSVLSSHSGLGTHPLHPWLARPLELPGPASAPMARAPTQATLAALWLEGRGDTMSALTQMKVWSLREAWKEFQDSLWGMEKFVAERVEKIDGSTVSPSSVHKLLARMDSDKAWFPGKVYRERNGPMPALTGQARAAIARSAMAHKGRGGEPTYRAAVACCPAATRNPQTGAPVDKKRVYSVFRSECHDGDPEEPWACRPRLSKTAFTEPVRMKRLAFGHHIQSLNHPDGYYYRHVVWTDLCHEIMPLTEQKAAQQAQSRKGRRGWMSEGQQEFSANLRGPREATRQHSWGTRKVWWFPMLVRGKLHLEVLPAGFPGECPEGAAILVEIVRDALNLRFPNAAKPRVLFVDRGKGFYATSTGRMTPEFQMALRRQNLVAFMGDDASEQPGALAQVLLHETAVAWSRNQLKLTSPRQPWKETREDFATRLREVCRFINAKYQVEGLCREFPMRIQLLIDKKGDSLRK